MCIMCLLKAINMRASILYANSTWNIKSNENHTIAYTLFLDLGSVLFTKCHPEFREAYVLAHVFQFQSIWNACSCIIIDTSVASTLFLAAFVHSFSHIPS